ncbi:hypothetical protein Rvan_0085 [Rhodomicrobium vannielii ATCC 17100]|uniref:Uncharacterized protein n=1 Tax=Rhodomicrobium vannielii (strain ATCC 17100 / DSM 162 / LMG 4299 / NCIMB 10020 / ATH 3.1.1) TaxID=648757 RepID=E3I521_RHOVT|nr:hypothetical protein Rvan_0085 [Rhodomicrobium vannielii ATCC 17100]
MPQALKWSFIAAVAVLVAGAGWLMITRGPALLLDLGGAIVGCF